MNYPNATKREVLAQERVAGYSVREAAERAGYNAKYAYRVTRADPRIAARIAEIRAQHLQAADISAQRVMLELGRVAFTDVRKLFDDDGGLLPTHLLDDDTAAAVAGVEVETKGKRVQATDPDTGEPIFDLATGEPVYERQATTTKVKLRDKAPALGTLAKHFKLVGDEGDGVNALAAVLADRLKNARNRLDAIDAEDVEPRMVDNLAG